MKKYLHIISKSLLAILALILVSCEKDIEVELPEVEEKLVVEGWIEQGQTAIISITRNSPYFEPVDTAFLNNLFVDNAIVNLSDGQTTEALNLSFNPSSGWPFIYYESNIITGQLGGTYSLTIEVENKTITAVTTIPQMVQFDSVWFEREVGEDSLGYIWARFNDDPNSKNYYRLFTKRIGKDDRYVPILGSTYDDIYFDGLEFTFSMYRGFDNLNDDAEFEQDDAGYFSIGDTVVVKYCAIDENHYLFWRTAESEIFSGGNPFVNPSTIQTNMVGEALGIFGGYAATYDTVICQ